MSVQFRHPRGSQKTYTVPAAPASGADGGRPPDVDAPDSRDIAAAIQYARLNADQLQIDKRNVFLVGQSKGSLVVLTGMMDDQMKTTLDTGDEPYLANSSKPRAVFGVQASATYDHTQVRDTFIKMNASTKTMENTNVTHLTLEYPSCVINTVFNYNCQYDLGEQTVNNPNGFPMSALDAMDAMDSPLWLRYDRRVTTSDGTPTGTIKKLGFCIVSRGHGSDAHEHRSSRRLL